MTIDAKIRISAITDQASKAIRALKAEADGLNTTGGSAKPAFTGVSSGAADVAVKAKAARKEVEALTAATTANIAAAKAEAEAVKTAQRAQKAAADEAQKAIRAAANQQRQLAPQLTDIVVGLSTGQSPFLVLLQQGGQLKDVFGGVGNAFKALSSIFTVGRVIIGGVAAAIGTVAFAAFQGSSELNALNKSLALTGNIAGTSAGQLDVQAKQIATLQNTAIGSVRETLAALVATGDFTSTSLNSAGRAAVALSKLTGESAVDTVKQFDGMSAGVAAWAAKSNQAYNFLSVAQFKQIQSLEAQGRSQEAMKLTLDALADTMEQRSAPAIGTFERLWNSVKTITSGVLDNLKAIGRDTTAEERIAALLKKLKDLQDSREIGSRGGKRKATFDSEIAATTAELEREKRLLADDQLRASERAIAAKTTQDEIKKSTKAYQDAISQLDQAAAQRKLAETLAGLDKERAAIELGHARGLDSQRDYDLALNAIEQRRLQAQAATIQQQIKIEKGRAIGKPEDTFARDANVQGLLGQLAQVRGQIAQATGQALVIAASDDLNTARDKAAQWEAIWKKAYDQVRALAAQQGAAQAKLIADPVLRATAEAAESTAELRRQIDELRRDLDLRLSLTVDPGQRAELQRQIGELGANAKAVIEEATRSGTLSSLQTQFAELNQALVLQEQGLTNAVEQGALSTEEAERRKFAARAASLPQLQAIVAAMQLVAATPAERNAIQGLTQELTKLKDATTEFQKSAKATAVGGLASALTDIATGAKTGKEALLDMVSSFAKALLDVLAKKLALKLVDGAIDAYDKFAAASSASSAGGSGGINYAGIFQAIFSAFHSGGVVGSSGGQTRSVAPAVFAFAPRYHAGGVAGLRPREVPAILEQGEEVLTADDPRHRNNLKSNSVGGVNIAVTVNGAQGAEVDQRGAAEQLTQRMRAVVVDWAAEQSRQGGMLAGGRR